MSKPFYITTSIPYATSEPHIGNVMDWLYADCLRRYREGQGDTVFYNAGSDEHGSKIAEKAEQAGKTPEDFVAELSPKIQAMHESIGSHPTHFQRTDADNHHEVAQKLWQQMAAKGDIYKGTYKGWYCTGCETFYTETEVKDNGGTCPLHNKPYVEIEEENYFFKLSAYGDKLTAAYQAGDTAVYPRSRQNEILSFIESGMQDLSISRPKSSVSWGIEVPGDADHVMYVWFEALMNYISCLGGIDGKDWNAWPVDTQICGKDNLRFHAAIWPAMLLSLEVSLVQKLMVHGFISVEGQKMSKTIGNVVQPADIIDEWGLDAYRYFFLRHVSWADDGDYAAGKFETAYNSELANDLGNLVGRVSNMVGKYLNGDLSAAPEVKLDTDDYHTAFEKLEINKAAGEAWRHVQSLNQYIEQNKPWQLAKAEDPRLSEIMNHLVGAMRAIAPLIEPFTPVSAGKIADVFAGDQLTQLDGVLFPKK